MGKPTGFLEVNRKTIPNRTPKERLKDWNEIHKHFEIKKICLLYTSPSPRDLSTSRMPSSA